MLLLLDAIPALLPTDMDLFVPKATDIFREYTYTSENRGYTK
jgi:hypothetical protein